MPPETEGLTTKAVLWEVAGLDNSGEVTLESPAEITVRLERGSHETRDSHGNVVAYDGLLTVDQEIEEGSRIWLGALEDLPSPNSSITDIYKVVQYNSVPDVKGVEYYRTIRIVKTGDRLPSLA